MPKQTRSTVINKSSIHIIISLLCSFTLFGRRSVPIEGWMFWNIPYNVVLLYIGYKQSCFCCCQAYFGKWTSFNCGVIAFAGWGKIPKRIDRMDWDMNFIAPPNLIQYIHITICMIFKGMKTPSPPYPFENSVNELKLFKYQLNNII